MTLNSKTSRFLRNPVVGLFVFGLTFGVTPFLGTLSLADNVILITMDGVRRHEVFEGTQHRPFRHRHDPVEFLFPNLFAKLKTLPKTLILGDPDGGDRNGVRLPPSQMRVANGNHYSLPGYQNIMAGRKTSCLGNLCNRIDFETLPEKLLREKELHISNAATFASWMRIDLAGEHKKGATTLTAGMKPFYDPAGAIPVPGTPESPVEAEKNLKELNQKIMRDAPPWGRAKWDKYTWELSLRYLKRFEPPFLWISMVDSDQWAHRSNYKNHANTLKMYDRWITDLLTQLEQMGEYGKNTTVIITTDHGRGQGALWSSHGPMTKASGDIWMIATGSGVLPNHNPARSRYWQTDLRPTMERLLGLNPTPCAKPDKDCGKAIDGFEAF